jgi:hypothetical protein
LPAVALCTALGVAAALAEPPKPPSYLSTKHVHIETAGRGATHTKTAKRNADAPGKAASERAASSKKSSGRYAA